MNKINITNTIKLHKLYSTLPKKLGFKTVKEGERLAVYSKNGSLTVHEGPTRVFLFRNENKLLERYVAQPDQHLILKYKTGEMEYIVGPKDVWEDPLIHESILLDTNIPIDSNEALVVYELNSNDEIERKIIKGPTSYVPKSSKEWIHEFSWHGSINYSEEKYPNQLKFQKLHLTPDQMYITLKDVRTKDDALLNFKFMIFFELENIEKMLDQTNDPIADLTNSLSADVINFTSKFNFMEFKDATSALNEVENYPQTNQRADKIGYFVKKIVLTTWKTNEKIQKMQDSAIETRTKLILDRENEVEIQNLNDFKLDKTIKRSEIERELLEKEKNHEEKLTQFGFENEFNLLKKEIFGLKMKI